MRQVCTALLSSSLDCGEKDVIVVGEIDVVVVSEIDVVVVGESVTYWCVPCEVNNVVTAVQNSRDIDPNEPTNMSNFVAFDCTQAAPQRLRLNEVASRNM